METIYYVLIFSLVGGLLSLSLAVLLLSRKSLTEKLIKFATPFAAGALLAAVFLDLLTEGAHEGNVEALLFSTLVGILLFFFAEKFLHWFHHHHDEDKARKKTSKDLIIFGDLAHNIMDGIAIAAAFLISVPTGIVTALAVAAHEIPQEVGDFGLLLSKGMKRKNVLLVNVVTALATTVAALITFNLGLDDRLPIEALLGLSAGFLLYIAMSDIIPTIHNTSNSKKLFEIQPIMLLLGVIIVAAAINISHQFIDDGHGHSHSSESSKVIDHEDHTDEHTEEHHDEEDHEHADE